MGVTRRGPLPSHLAPPEISAAMGALKSEPTLFTIRFQSPDLDVDVGVAVRLEMEKGGLTSLPTMAADLVQSATTCLSGYCGADSVRIYGKKPNAFERECLVNAGKDNSKSVEAIGHGPGVERPGPDEADPDSRTVRENLEALLGGHAGGANMVRRALDDLPATASTSSTGPSVAAEYMRSVRQLLAKLEDARKIAALKHSFVDIVSEKYTECVRKLEAFREDTLKEIANLRSQLLAQARDPTFQPRDVSFLTDEELQKSYCMPPWEKILEHVISHWEGEQLREFAFSKLAKAQTPNEQKLAIADGALTNEKDFHLHRNPQGLLKEATELQKTLDICAGEYFEHHKIVPLKEPPPPLPLFTASFERAKAICDVDGLEKQRRHSVTDFRETPSQYGDMRRDDTLDEKPAAHLHVVSITEVSTRSTSGVRTPQAFLTGAPDGRLSPAVERRSPSQSSTASVPFDVYPPRELNEYEDAKPKIAKIQPSPAAGRTPSISTPTTLYTTTLPSVTLSLSSASASASGSLTPKRGKNYNAAARGQALHAQHYHQLQLHAKARASPTTTTFAGSSASLRSPAYDPGSGSSLSSRTDEWLQREGRLSDKELQKQNFQRSKSSAQWTQKAKFGDAYRIAQELQRNVTTFAHEAATKSAKPEGTSFYPAIASMTKPTGKKKSGAKLPANPLRGA